MFRWASLLDKDKDELLELSWRKQDGEERWGLAEPTRLTGRYSEGDRGEEES